MISVIGIPLDENSSFMRGPAAAPSKIREAFRSPSANFFTESGLDLESNAGWKDVGDLSFASGEDKFARITENVAANVSASNKIFVLGGDHSITFPVIRGVRKHFKRLTIIQVDAHGDLYDNFDNNPHSHASPFARIMENNLADRLIQVGIRTMTTHQKEQASRFGVEVIEMKDWESSNKLKLGGPTYLTFDMDAIDPAFAPGVSHHEPGGISSRQALSFLQSLRGEFIGADLVEYNPERDPSGITFMLAGKLFKEILDLLLRAS